jgi:CubicO group peptidase (beta-lactamase class C family)
MNQEPGESAPYAALDAYISREMRQLHLPGVALAVIEGNQVTHTRGFGRASPHGLAPTPQTPFFIGSLTKSMTAVAIMQLVEGGRVALDAPVQQVLPWFRVADRQASAQITVRHLLHQTSGLPTVVGETPLADFDAAPGATERQARALAAVKLAHAPGAAFAYCNMNYNLLGLVVEAASGETYADYLQAHLFAPLEMRHTYITKAQAAAHGLALGHQLWFWRPRPAPDLAAPRGSLPSGQVISCTEDLAHYVIALLHGGRYGNTQILSAAGIAELQRGAAEFRQWGMALGSYAMGWFVGTAGPAPLIWHTGNVPDFSAYMALLPQQGAGIVLLANAGHHMLVPVCAEWGAGAAAGCGRMGAPHRPAAPHQSAPGRRPDPRAGQTPRLPAALSAGLYLDRPAVRRLRPALGPGADRGDGPGFRGAISCLRHWLPTRSSSFRATGATCRRSMR